MLLGFRLVLILLKEILPVRVSQLPHSEDGLGIVGIPSNRPSAHMGRLQVVNERDKRDIHLERSIEADLDRSASGFAAWLAADQTSPSRHLMQNEEMLRLVDALARLPDRMREVVVLKHCQGWTLQRIADHIGRSVPAVASLLRRGLAALRRELDSRG